MEGTRTAAPLPGLERYLENAPRAIGNYQCSRTPRRKNPGNDLRWRRTARTTNLLNPQLPVTVLQIGNRIRAATLAHVLFGWERTQ